MPLDGSLISETTYRQSTSTVSQETGDNKCEPEMEDSACVYTERYYSEEIK